VTPTPTAAPVATPTPSPAPTYGTLVVSPTALQVDKKRPYGAFTVHQSGPSGQITISSGVGVCNGDIASLTVLPASAPVGPNTTTINVSARGHGASSPNGTCAIRVQGMAGMATTVNVTFGKTDCNGQGEGNYQCENAVRRAPTGTGVPNAPGSPAAPGAPTAAPTAPGSRPGPAQPAGPASGAGPSSGAAPGRPGPGIPH
jgi:hypothetical protein